MEFKFYILEQTITADVEYDVTYPGAKEEGPSYACGGQPAEPPEWVIKDIALTHKDKPLDCPPWLRQLLENDDNLYDEILEDIHRS